MHRKATTVCRIIKLRIARSPGFSLSPSPSGKRLSLAVLAPLRADGGTPDQPSFIQVFSCLYLHEFLGWAFNIVTVAFVVSHTFQWAISRPIWFVWTPGIPLLEVNYNP